MPPSKRRFMAERVVRVDLGRRDFEEALTIQRELVIARRAERVGDVLLFVEHPPTYTVGSGAGWDHLLSDRATLERLGARLIETDRGGDITFHGPGQLVGYPIIDLRRWKKDVHEYLRALEQTLIEALRSFGVETAREEGLTGVWHPQGKLAAIGVRVTQWVTSHGFALNVATDLDYFEHIVPCGIVGRAASSMEQVLRAPVSRQRAMDAVAGAFGRVFEREVIEAREADLEIQPQMECRREAGVMPS